MKGFGRHVARSDGSDPWVSISGDSANELGTSLVRVINATPNVGEVHVRTDDVVVASSVPYQSVLEYARIPDTSTAFEVSAAPGNVWRRFGVKTQLLTDGHRYTLTVLIGDDSLDFETRVVPGEVSGQRVKRDRSGAPCKRRTGKYFGNTWMESGRQIL